MAEVDRIMMEHARKTELVTEISKIGRARFVTIQPVSTFDLVITDNNEPVGFIPLVTNLRIRVVVASVE